MMHAVAVGEMFDSIVFHGPFTDFEEAATWAEQEIGSSQSWWVVGLDMPWPENPRALFTSVDPELLQKQYEKLGSLIAFHVDDPEMALLDGLFDMIGVMLPRS
jgi:hypothetical protein